MEPLPLLGLLVHTTFLVHLAQMERCYYTMIHLEILDTHKVSTIKDSQIAPIVQMAPMAPIAQIAPMNISLPTSLTLL